MFGTFVNGESIVCNTSFFFCFECTKMMVGAINRELCSVLLPTLVHSDQTSRRVGFPSFYFLSRRFVVVVVVLVLVLVVLFAFFFAFLLCRVWII